MLRHALLPLFVAVAVAASSSKIAAPLELALATEGSANVVVIFQSTAPVLASINAARFTSRAAKTTAMKQQLENLRQSSQKNAINLLKARSVSYSSYWINNHLIVKNASPVLVQQLAELPEVSHIRKEIIATIETPISQEISSKGINANEWNIDKIEASEAWALPGGNDGSGVVISTIDTGVRYTHEALRNQFRADHGWFDPYSSSENPEDAGGHGTHTMGTILGSGGIGVAPGSQWISCRGCSSFSCTEDALDACGQFVTCPTNADGSGEDCSKAPGVVSNSWGGGGGQDFYESVVNAWRTADIIPVFSQGNSGPSCGSAGSPGDYANVIGTGSTDASDTISSFSSRGPSRSGGHIKPDISAPGGNVRSSWSTSDTAYNTISGTSMAAPHITGVVSLLLAQDKNLSYDQVSKLLNDNAERQGLGQAAACGGVENNVFPNNVYGHGRANARRSLAAAISGKF